MCDQPDVQNSVTSVWIWLALHKNWSMVKKHFRTFIGNSMIGLRGFSMKGTLNSHHQLKDMLIEMGSMQHFVHGRISIWTSTSRKNVSEQALPSRRILRLGLIFVHILMWVSIESFNGSEISFSRSCNIMWCRTFESCNRAYRNPFFLFCLQQQKYPGGRCTFSDALKRAKIDVVGSAHSGIDDATNLAKLVTNIIYRGGQLNKINS